MPPITRREQLELDELLGDIYRGIETLPDKAARQGGGLVTSSAYDILKSPAESHARSNLSHNNKSQQPRVIGRAYVREYELAEESPLVQQHRRELAALRNREGASSGPNYSSPPGGGGGGSGSKRSNIKSPQRAPTGGQSGANQVGGGSATPESKRRVCIVDPESSSAQQRQSRASKQTNFDTQYQVQAGEDEEEEEEEEDDGREYALNDSHSETPHAQQQQQRRGGGASNSKQKKQRKQQEKVKYVNTNKFIYHQEWNPDDDPLDELSDLDELESGRLLANKRDARNPDEGDDIDGVTRVEYYHTSWLDRQLGRNPKRRSSKELSERQVKEKAMIEELKRGLKSGAITLRQSLNPAGGGANTKKAPVKPSDYFADDQFLDSYYDDHENKHYNTAVTHTKYTTEDLKHHKHRNKQQPSDSPSKVIGSGLATLPRNYHNNRHTRQPQPPPQIKPSHKQAQDAKKPTSGYQFNRFDSVYQSSTYDPYNHQQPQQQQPMQTPFYRGNTPSDQHSRTLPNERSTAGQQPHQLLQSHYRGHLRDTTNRTILSGSPARPSPLPVAQQQQQQQQQHAQQQAPPVSFTSNYSQVDKMRFTGYNNNNCASPSQQHGPKSPVRQQLQANSSISGVPSATEVVRSALSRSGSQVSLNQLNKTINLLPNSPPAASPMTPTQQLRAVSPSLSPSPQPASSSRCTPNQQYSSKTLGHRPSNDHHQQAPSQRLPGQIVLHGTRTIGRPPQHQQQQQQQYSTASNTASTQQPIYANPHASFLNHRMEQQMKQPNRNTNSIREFNELDSLLRSLGPSSATYGGSARGPSTCQTSAPGLGGGTTSNSAGPAVHTHITPGFSSKPAQVSFGGFMPPNQQHQQQQPMAAARPNQADIYAQVQKPQQQFGAGTSGVVPTSPNQQQFTVDVTEKKYDENSLRLQRQHHEALSEFESPIELVPSMEDYQNISKLNPVKNHYWYKPNMSRDLAISLLKDKPQGTFIVRDSTSFRGAYGLAVKVSKLPKNILANFRSTNSSDPSSEYIRHFLIEPTSGGVRLKGYANEPVFESLPDLIYQHSLTELALPCKLIIPRADIEDSRFNQKQKQFFEEFLASKEQAKHQPYERTSPDGGYRRYPGDVLVHNEHRIIFQ